MFNKQLKTEIQGLKAILMDQESRLSKLEEDYADYLEWKKQRDANEKAAATQGHWYISSKDAALIEKCIQEINKNEDLCALLTSAEGTTLSLRVHPQPKFNGSVARFNGLGEED
jgi:hypothetical protein